MSDSTPYPERHDYLRRCRLNATGAVRPFIWSMTIEDRKTGWLIPIFYYKFRELLTHAAFRYSFCCPIYCLMPDHIHMPWLGLADRADQLLAARYMRTHLNRVLEKLGVRLQIQGYDHVLREDEHQQDAFEAVVDYIARNPERAGLVTTDCFPSYPYSGCLLPGYPDLSPWQPGFWPLFWRLVTSLGRSGLLTAADESEWTEPRS